MHFDPASHDATGEEGRNNNVSTTLMVVIFNDKVYHKHNIVTCIQVTWLKTNEIRNVKIRNENKLLYTVHTCTYINVLYTNTVNKSKGNTESQ